MAGKLEIIISELIIQGHAVLRAASTNPGDIHAQGMTFQVLLREQILNRNSSFGGKGNLFCVFHIHLSESKNNRNLKRF